MSPTFHHPLKLETTMTPRELYHTVRRALTYVSKPHGTFERYYVHRRVYSLDAAEKQARIAVLLRLDRYSLPRGMAPTFKAAVRAVYQRNTPFYVTPLDDRLRGFISERCCQLIRDRGGETEVGGTELVVLDRQRPYVLLYTSGWREYSRAFGARKASLAYLCGRDDNGPWAARVPASVSTVTQALDYLVPAEVKRAQLLGRRVLRQGDVFVIERTRDGMDLSPLPAGHTWLERSRLLVHVDGHQALYVPFPAIAIQNKALLMGRRTGLMRSAPERARD